MTTHDLSRWRHDHAFDAGNRAGERRTWAVVAITAATMVAEIVAGVMTGSMALLADGWHMATHVVALSIAGAAYLLARRWSRDARFTFGTWKIEVLGAFSSALLLGVVALAMVIESVHRLVEPAPIQFGVALGVAGLGLVVNLVSAWILESGHDHDHGHAHGRDPSHDHHEHDHDHGHDHGHGHAHGAKPRAHAAEPKHHDINLRSAYVHVLADAFTSVLAIVALAAGLWMGWTWLDPVMGLVGSGVIVSWVATLMRDSSRILLDREMDAPVVDRIRGAIESDGDAEIADLHVWRVGRASHAAIITVVADRPLTPAAYRARLVPIGSLAHVSVEVNRCPKGECPK
ncbi:MAG TPA: CDF family Co(II)/Ni(II) efflux transporter DmeF [Usitatibacter sp.]|jgi:cation diffusion facilitator family transporter|nr:CDF family Co(II)/Ni(II) efflux transporter DmeF [Usitatibacter sp.]